MYVLAGVLMARQCQLAEVFADRSFLCIGVVR